MIGSIALHHINILTPNIEGTIAFYQDLMRMQLTARFYQKDAFDIAFLQDSQASSNFFLKLTAPPYDGWVEEIYNRRGPHMDHVTFLVDDLDAWYENLRERGINFLTKPQLFCGAKQVHFYDSSGVIVEISEVLDSSLFPKQTAKGEKESIIECSLHHVSILCHDLSGEERFYSTALGLETVYGYEGIVFFADPSIGTDHSNTGPLLEIIGPPGLWEREVKLLDEYGPCLDHLSFLVEDVDHMHENLVSKGVQFEIEPMDYGSTRLAFLRDPNNVYIELELPVWEERLVQWQEKQD